MMGQKLPRLAARLEEVRSGIAALAQSRERVQAQIAVLEQQGAKLGGQAAKARQMGRKDLVPPPPTFAPFRLTPVRLCGDLGTARSDMGPCRPVYG